MKPFILITILSRLFYEKIQCDAYDTYENRFVDSDDCKLKFGNSCFVYDKINKIATSTTCNEALRKLTTDDCRKIPVRFGWEVCNVGKSPVLLNERKSRYKLNGKTKHKVRRILDPNICDVHYEYGDIKTCDEKPKMLTTSVRGYDNECKADVSYLVAVKDVVPSAFPSTVPSVSLRPSMSPSVSSAPTISSIPSELPSYWPTLNPTALPSVTPSGVPSTSTHPTFMPSISPSKMPSKSPSAAPTFLPSISSHPSRSPSDSPSLSSLPSCAPSKTPSVNPSSRPTLSKIPSSEPSTSNNPSMTPSYNPSVSKNPSSSPSPSLSSRPSSSQAPSSLPSANPVSRRLSGTKKGKSAKNICQKSVKY